MAHVFKLEYYSKQCKNWFQRIPTFRANNVYFSYNINHFRKLRWPKLDYLISDISSLFSLKY